MDDEEKKQQLMKQIEKLRKQLEELKRKQDEEKKKSKKYSNKKEGPVGLPDQRGSGADEKPKR